MAEVTREHREAAFQTTFLRPSEDGDRARGWVNTGEYGHGTRAEWRQLDFLAQAIAEAEALGRAAERADVVAMFARTAGHFAAMQFCSLEYMQQAWVNMGERIKRGEHVGAAGKDGG